MDVPIDRGDEEKVTVKLLQTELVGEILRTWG